MKTPASIQQLTVDRIYDEPNLSGVAISDISWRPDGGMLTYIRGDGARNEIWGFDIASGKGRRLYVFAPPSVAPAGPARHYGRSAFRRGPVRTRRAPAAETLSYCWSPDAKGLLVTGPTGIPQLLNLRANKLLPIMQNPQQPVFDAKFSPDGRYVSFVRGFDLHMMDLVTGREIAVTWGSTEQLRSATPDSLGDLLWDAGHWWSPDSRRIAYLQTDEQAVDLFEFTDLTSSTGSVQSERYPRPGRPNPTIGLRVASAQGSLWIDTRAWASCYLARVAWLPDSRHLLLQMLSRPQQQLAVVLADARTGATRQILTETSATWINVVDDLRFLAGGRCFLWSSEKESSRHLYIHDTATGRQLVRLTKGPESSVAVDAVDERKGAVYYLVFPEPHTEGQLKRVDYRVDARRYTAAGSRVITGSPGTHFAHLSPDCRYFADISSTAVNPPRLELRRADGRHLAVIEENPCEELAAFGLRPFAFRAHRAPRIGDPSDAMRLYSKLLEPANRVAGRKYPVVIYVYGGPLPDGFALARNVMNYWRPVPELWMQMMAQRGYGVFSLDNRGSNAAPRGHAWEAPIHRRLGHVELIDQLEGVSYLKTLDWVDPGRIGILGGSFGGFMALNAMLRSPGTFKAGIAFAPVTNWSEYDSVYTERYMDLPAANPKGYADTALTAHARDLAGALLLLHGTGDDNVHIQHSIQLIDALLGAGKDFDMMLYPRQSHMSFFGLGQDPDRLWNEITKFFLDKL